MNNINISQKMNENKNINFFLINTQIFLYKLDWKQQFKLLNDCLILLDLLMKLQENKYKNQIEDIINKNKLLTSRENNNIHRQIIDILGNDDLNNDKLTNDNIKLLKKIFIYDNIDNSNIQNAGLNTGFSKNSYGGNGNENEEEEEKEDIQDLININNFNSLQTNIGNLLVNPNISERQMILFQQILETQRQQIIHRQNIEYINIIRNILNNIGFFGIPPAICWLLAIRFQNAINSSASLIVNTTTQAVTGVTGTIENVGYNIPTFFWNSLISVSSFIRTNAPQITENTYYTNFLELFNINNISSTYNYNTNTPITQAIENRAFEANLTIEDINLFASYLLFIISTLALYLILAIIICIINTGSISIGPFTGFRYERRRNGGKKTIKKNKNKKKNIKRNKKKTLKRKL